jgi:hypothetical protein
MLLAAVASTAGGHPMLAALLAGVLVSAAAFAPRAYTLDRSALTVERWVLPVRIPLRSIRRTATIDATELRGAIRTFGSGGLFGIYGRFWSRKFGHFRMYATRSKGFVIIEAGTRYLLTPNSPAAFVAAVERACAERAGEKALS